jgi:hypothetical protein
MPIDERLCKGFVMNFAGVDQALLTNIDGMA